MFKKPLGLLGIFLVVVGIGYFIGAGVRVHQGARRVWLAAVVQRGTERTTQATTRTATSPTEATVEGGQAIMSLLKDDWKNFPVVEGDMDPNDPLVNTASEYMYQMATISFHTLNGTQVVVLTADDIAAAIGSEQLDADGTYNGVVEAYQGQVLEPRELRRSGQRPLLDRLQPDRPPRRPRDMAWSGTAHALVAELGVGAATHSTLQLALGVAALLAGLGVVSTVSGVAFIWHTRNKHQERRRRRDGRRAGADRRQRLTATVQSNFNTSARRAPLSRGPPWLRRGRRDWPEGDPSAMSMEPTTELSPTRYFWLQLAGWARASAHSCWPTWSPGAWTTP